MAKKDGLEGGKVRRPARKVEHLLSVKNSNYLISRPQGPNKQNEDSVIINCDDIHKRLSLSVLTLI